MMILELKYIKDNIIIYFREYYKQEIKQINEIIKVLNYIKVKEISKMKETIDELKYLRQIADSIEKVKNFLLFNVIYERNRHESEMTKFNKANKILEEIGEVLLKNDNSFVGLYKEFKNIFDEIRKRLINNEEKTNNFIRDMSNYFNIRNNNQIMKDLVIFFKIKKYEIDINSVIYFLKYFQRDNKEWNDKLNPKYENLSSRDFPEIKEILMELKRNGIYDYQDRQNYNKIFICLYNKKGALEYLLTKTTNDLENLKNQIQSNDNNIISIKEINDTKQCIEIMNKMKKLRDNFQIFKYIRSLSVNIIEQFFNYSEIYLYLIELEEKCNIENAINRFNSCDNKDEKIIGKGAYGKVYLIENNGKKYALKKIFSEMLEKEELLFFEKESKILSSLNDEYIIKYYYSFKENHYFNIIMEYGGNNLKQFIANYKEKNQLIGEKIILDIIKQICLGIKAIHKNKIIHRDLKPENIFINENNKIKIGDFGISKKLETNKTARHSNIGTEYYMAPEIRKRQQYNNKVDIYSLGCIIYELFTLNEYYEDKLDDKICKIDLEVYDKKWQELIDSLMKRDYHERPNIDEVLANYFN